MSKGDGGVSFGFAPHGKLGQQETKPRVRPQPVEKATATRLSEVSAFSSKTNWAWLVIGLLLGAGGTMLGSSLWLQGNYVNPSVAMDAGPTDTDGLLDEQTELEPNGTGPALAPEVDGEAVTTPEPSKLAADSLKPLQDEPSSPALEQSEMLLVSGNDLETVVESETLATAEESLETVALPGNRDMPTSMALPSTQQAELDDVTIAAVDVPAATQDAGSPPPPVRETGDDETIDTSSSIPDSARSSLDETAAVQDVERIGLDADRSEGLSELDLATVGSEASVPGTKVIGGTDQAVNEDKPAGDTRPVRASERIYRVQLAAVNDEAAAETYWQEVTTLLPELFTDIEPVFDRREVDERIFFRIWIGEFEKRVDADDYCGWLKSKGQDCFVTRG